MTPSDSAVSDESYKSKMAGSVNRLPVEGILLLGLLTTFMNGKTEKPHLTMEQPKYKSFTYHASVEWSTDRQGMLRAEGKPAIEISSPPEFKGLPGFWTPEDFLVAAAEMCTMSTFLSFGSRKNIPLISYRSSAEGLLEFVEGKYQFTKITIQPEITVANSWTRQQVEELVHKAHEHCLIANSLKAEVIITPCIIIV